MLAVASGRRRAADIRKGLRAGESELGAGFGDARRGDGDIVIVGQRGFDNLAQRRIAEAVPPARRDIAGGRDPSAPACRRMHSGLRRHIGLGTGAGGDRQQQRQERTDTSWPAAGVDAGDDRHAGPSRSKSRLTGIDGDAHTDALRHLHEIAGGIVGLQHREFRSRRRRQLSSTWPVNLASASASTRKLAGCPGAICAVWASL